MFDRRLQPVMKTALAAPARTLADAGVSADGLTMLGFAVGMGGVALLALQAYLPALVLLLSNRLLDGLDGAVARATRPTDRGAFLDIALDFVFYASVPFGFALADPARNAPAACGLLVGFMGTASSFLAFAVIAERRGISSVAFPHKGLHYLGGLTEGAETIAFFALMCLLPDWFPALAWSFAALCLVTTATRWVWGWAAFSERN